MKKIQLGILLGTIAGFIDVILIAFQKLTWDANLSAFTFWIIAGFFIATTNLNLKGALKGIIVSILLLIPVAFIIGWQNPTGLIPIILINIIFGSILGFLIDKAENKQKI